jgi:lipoic acid synthetase
MNTSTTTARRPEWLRVKIHETDEFRELKGLSRGLRLTTVCEEARCPNIYECWSNRTATFMLFGETCTRRCGFCAVATGLPGPLDPEEPDHVAEAVKTLGIAHAVITSVNRDDLKDGGAPHFARTIRKVRELNPLTRIEVLIPDFQGNELALRTVMEARPDVLAHNTETVPRLYRNVRVGSRYKRTLELLLRAKGYYTDEYPVITKTGVMCGLGETRDELAQVMDDLLEHGVDVLTLGQYLQPTKAHLPVVRFYHPDEFAELRRIGLEKGFKHVEAGPLVRSSYHAHTHVPVMSV